MKKLTTPELRTLRGGTHTGCEFAESIEEFFCCYLYSLPDCFMTL